jgi:hypothetical protein
MIIDEKALMAMSKLGKADLAESGLYIEGFEGGITLYAFNGYSLFRRIMVGDNTRKFIQHLTEWTMARPNKRFAGKKRVSAGYVTAETFTNSEEIVNSCKKPVEMVDKFKTMLDQDKTLTEAFARVNGRDFIKAVNTVTTIRRGEQRQSVVLSFHNGFLDVGTWTGPNSYAPGEEFGVWEEVVPALQIEGAVRVDKAPLVAMRTSGDIIIDLVSQLDIPIFRYRNEEMDSVIIPMSMEEDEQEIFLSVMGYEYHSPRATGIPDVKAQRVKKAVKALKEKKVKEKKSKTEKPVVQEVPVTSVVPKPVLIPGTKEVTITIYGDSEGWWVRFPKKIIEKYNLWGNISETSWESKILIFCPEGAESEAMLDVIRNDGYVVNIVRPPRETKKSSICFLPHYQGAVNHQKAG